MKKQIVTLKAKPECYLSITNSCGGTEDVEFDKPIKVEILKNVNSYRRIGKIIDPENIKIADSFNDREYDSNYWKKMIDTKELNGIKYENAIKIYNDIIEAEKNYDPSIIYFTIYDIEQ